jgi:N-acetylmuramoyl-L-alanine amidase
MKARANEALDIPAHSSLRSPGERPTRRTGRLAQGIALGLLAGLLAACGSVSTSPSGAPLPSTSAPASIAPSVDPAMGTVEPAPGSDSELYPPNPAAIVVAVEAGHGGCLDWGVPDPSERGQAYAEETMTLAIARQLRDLLVADGVGVVMIRDDDEALAGDDYPPLDCHGPPWRDVNGDGIAGFGPDVPEGTRTRDELQARLDLANLSAADALVSIHINSPTQGGAPVEIAFTETFYTDETSWGTTETERLAAAVQAGVVEQLAPLARYERGDRGITAHNFYMVAPPLFETTEVRPDPVKQPTRGGLMPVVLAEVGSINLRAEHDLLVSPEGQAAVAAGLFDGLAEFFNQRELAGRIGLADAVGSAALEPVDGDGPPFWAPVAADGPLRLRLTNTGTQTWPSDLELVAGWDETDQPYLRRAPEGLDRLDAEVPALAPGESVVVETVLPAAPDARGVAWISLMGGDATLADRGSPALQLASEAP